MKATVIETVPQEKLFLCEHEPVLLSDDTEQREYSLLCLFPEITYQQVLGFGGAFTEASALAWNALSDRVKDDFCRAYFDPDDGIGYNFGRVPLNSCDFGVDEYDFVEPGDETLDSFDISHDKREMLPMIRAAKCYSRDLLMFASPWSPPAYMKTNGSRVGGKLKDEYRALWAKYFARFIEEYKKAGVDIWGVTVQNEAKAVQTWESCVYTAQEEYIFVRDYLIDALKPYGTKIMFWDHNKERLLERSAPMYADKKVRDAVYGIACHWYSGDHFDQVRMYSELYPDKAIILSECCRANTEKGIKVSAQIPFAEDYAHEIIGDFANGISAFTDWNLALDINNGPYHDRPTVERQCDAPIICDAGNDCFVKNTSYYYIGQFSKYIQRGAKRIGSSCYNRGLETIAFKNPDGSVILIVLNRTESTSRFAVSIEGKLVELVSKKRSIMTVKFEN